MLYFVLGAFMKQYTECCLNCSTVTEGPRQGAVSLWFPCTMQVVQLGGDGRGFLSVPGLFLGPAGGPGASWERMREFPRVTFGSLSRTRLSGACDLQSCTT